jgi:hypothetical protein
MNPASLRSQAAIGSMAEFVSRTENLVMKPASRRHVQLAIGSRLVQSAR